MSLPVMNLSNSNPNVDGQNVSVSCEQSNCVKSDMLQQEVNIAEFNQILLNQLSMDEQVVAKGNIESLLTELASVIEKSDEAQDFLNWFNDLSEIDQQVVFQLFSLFSNVTYSNVNSFTELSNNGFTNINNNDFASTIISSINSTDIQNYISNPTFQSLQSLISLDNQSDMQKMFSFFDQNKQKIESLLLSLKEDGDNSFNALVQKSTNQSFLNNSNNTNSKVSVENTYLNLQNNSYLINNQSTNMENLNREFSSSDDSTTKVFDLNQVQMNFNNKNLSNVVSKVESTIPNQNIENLLVDKNFSEEFGKLLIKNVTLPNGESQMNIQLQPKELGQISVKLSSQEGIISAQIIVQSALGKELMDSQIHQLKQSLVVQGYQVDKIEVQQVTSTQNNQNLNSGFNFSREQSTSNQYNEQNTSKYSNGLTEDEEEFKAELSNVSGIDYTI